MTKGLAKADAFFKKTFRPISRPTSALRPVRAPAFPLPAVLHARLLSSETRAAIDKAVASAPVVLFMKGTPETPQCGFSRASIQILGLQGVDPKKFVAFNVLEDPELRQGMFEHSSCLPRIRSSHRVLFRRQGLLGLADHPAAVSGQRICGWMRHPDVYASKRGAR